MSLTLGTWFKVVLEPMSAIVFSVSLVLIMWIRR
jgi:hypothetical protein